MTWMHIVGFLLILSGFVTIFKEFFVALLLIVGGTILFQCGINKVAAEKREKEEQDRIARRKAIFAAHNSTSTSSTAPQRSSVSPSILDSFTRYGTSAPNVYMGFPMVYRYPNVPVSDVNRTVLSTMVTAKTFDVTLIKGATGEIFLQQDNRTVAKLEDKIQMSADWLEKGFPVRCEFVAFAPGKEKVALFFYKDLESSLKDNKCEIIKLTSYLSASKQETISLLENGEKLFIDSDDNDKPYLRDIQYHPIGNLPAKYAKLYEDDAILGVFFDHTDKKESDNYEQDDKYIPYVRVYISE